MKWLTKIQEKYKLLNTATNYLIDAVVNKLQDKEYFECPYNELNHRLSVRYKLSADEIKRVLSNTLQKLSERQIKALFCKTTIIFGKGK